MEQADRPGGWITLGEGADVVVISTLGAGLHRVRLAGSEVMPEDTEDARVGWSSGISLAPWPNRLRGGSWEFDGTTLTGECNEAKGNALHGLVFGRDFDVVQVGPTAVTLECRLGDDAVYPFPVTIVVEYLLRAGDLAVTMSATNHHTVAVPVALGTHPYFVFGPDSTITTSARSITENDALQIPTGSLLPPTAVGITPDEPTLLAGLVLDDCFGDLARDGTGWAHTVLRHGDGTVVDVRQDAHCPYTMIFINHSFPWAAGAAPAVAIEPQTVLANALQTGEGLHWLQPGETWGMRWGIAVTSAPESDS